MTWYRPPDIAPDQAIVALKEEIETLRAELKVARATIARLEKPLQRWW